jgi:hypothetical protein
MAFTSGGGSAARERAETPVRMISQNAARQAFQREEDENRGDSSAFRATPLGKTRGAANRACA